MDSIREIEIAREVQRRLFPQRVPELPHAQIAARCIQARSVGGDFYDFLDLGPERVGLVLGDVSGKGIPAALRMANLQAYLRVLTDSAPQDPLRVMRQVNRSLWQNTPAGDFATLFFGIFTGAARRLTYINCGHNPPLCVRRDGTIERLAATATVLGAFEEWECGLGRTQLFPGDLLVVYSDGVTDARRGDQDFGEEGLIEVLRACPDLAPEALVSAILDRVQEFGAGDGTDDLTLLVARIR
jgi:serine phosphatase RsbU (regulator of sigma subunit)